MFKRQPINKLSARLREPRSFIQVLMGPRQVGKTTLVYQLLPDLPNSIYESADTMAANAVWLEQIWEGARVRLQLAGMKEITLVVDEIQKIGNWSEIVKKLWDEDTRLGNNIKVLLLGSSCLLMQQGLTESLTGRFESTYLGHWSFLEMQEAFGWTADQFVWYGGYPGSAALIFDEPRWKKYISDSLIETSISKDILMLSRVDKPALMKRLFEIGCIYSGQILSYTKIVGQLLDVGNTITLSHYLYLLDTAGLLAGIEKYSSDIIRKRSSSPKFQVHNTALISAQSNNTFDKIKYQPEAWGRIVESAVGAHLLNASLEHGLKLYYWRHRNEEVDFVIEKRSQVIGIEVKTNTQKVTGGMKSFQEKYKPEKILLVGKSGIPWQEFLKMDVGSLF
ncbi:MAG: ATP-binding protein [Bacteroidetes bacterium]|jgi:predicted AAA+ superfamily ATPase|nr:ATP-binding protein [Bacteroidota bacterium]MCB0605147.1 ATP-binding protein [Saprospiraceae bacterium]